MSRSLDESRHVVGSERLQIVHLPAPGFQMRFSGAQPSVGLASLPFLPIWSSGAIAAALVSSVVVAGGESAGARLQKKVGLEDPAIAAGRALGAMLTGRTGLGERPPPAEPIGRSAVRALASDGPVLLVRTVSWGLYSYILPGGPLLKLDPEHPRPGCMIEADLLEAKSGRVLWNARCRSFAASDAPRLTLEEFLADDAALLRALLADLGADCGAELADALLARRPTS